MNRSGSWFAYGEDRVQGRDGLRKMLQDSPDTLGKLEKEVRAKLGMTADTK